MKEKIVPIGGGTGGFVVNSGLRWHDVSVSSVANVFDNGGGSGMLRNDLGVLPPGDLRQQILALSKSDDERTQRRRRWFNSRIREGHMKGQCYGNIFLSGFEWETGSIEEAIEEAREFLRVDAEVIPVTLDKAHLLAKFKDGREIFGEKELQMAELSLFSSLELSPKVKVNPRAVQAVHEADKIVICPGNFYCSIIPVLLPLQKAISESSAKVIFVCNLMTKRGHTDGMTVLDFVVALEKILGKGVIHSVIYNIEYPPEEFIATYREEGGFFVQTGDLAKRPDINFVGRDLVSKRIPKEKEGDPLQRTLVRHDGEKLARAILEL